MDNYCQHCGAFLKSWDIYEFFYKYYMDKKCALKAAKQYGWSTTNRLCFINKITYHPENESPYDICLYCKWKDPFRKLEDDD